MSTYNGTNIKDLDVTTPTEGAAGTIPEFNDCMRETKLVLKNQNSITTITELTSLTAAHSVIVFGATCTGNLPSASSVASSTFTKKYYFINPVGSGFTGTIGGTVSGVVNPTLAAGENMIVYTDGTTWFEYRGKYSSQLHDGTAYRLASATPAANTVPVREADGYLSNVNLSSRFIDITSLKESGVWNNFSTGTPVLDSFGRDVSFAYGGTLNDSTFYCITDYPQIFATGKIVKVRYIIKRLEVVTNQDVHLKMRAYAVTVPTDTENHIGFKIINARIWASNANGATQTTTDTGVDLSAGYQFTRLEKIISPGTDIKFYVNGVLKATHTTNMPAFTSAGFVLGGKNNTLGASARIMFGSILLEREY